MHRQRWTSRWITVCVGVAAVSACSDSTGPENFDPVTISNAATEVLAAFDNNPALQALDILDGAFPALGSQAAPPASETPLQEDLWPDGIGTDLRLLDMIGPFLNPANPAAIFPADFLGKTFVYNAETGKYEVAPDSAGAPENGIWLKLYAVDPVLHRPLTPLDDIGYLELTDESTPSADALGVVAVVNEITYLDYLASAVQETGSVTFIADGTLSDGVKDVEFTLSHEWSEATGITVDYEIWVPTDRVLLDLYVNLDPQTETLTLTLTVDDDGETVVLAGTVTVITLDGTITYEDNVVVNISGTPQQPVFTDADDNELTNQELHALAALFGCVGLLLDGFDNLLIPAYLVFSISVFGGW